MKCCAKVQRGPFEEDQPAVEKCALQNSGCKTPDHKLLQDLPQLERKVSNLTTPVELILDGRTAAVCYRRHLCQAKGNDSGQPPMEANGREWRQANR